MADWDLRDEHLFSELTYLHNMHFDSTLADLTLLVGYSFCFGQGVQLEDPFLISLKPNYMQRGIGRYWPFFVRAVPTGSGYTLLPINRIEYVGDLKRVR